MSSNKRYKRKHKTNPEQLRTAIQSQSRDMDADNQIKHHRDNETNRIIEGKPSRRHVKRLS